MTTVLKASAAAFVFAAACAAAACGSGNAELSLAGPSSSGSATSTSGATITGRVNGGSGLARTTSSITPSSTANITVTVAGTTISAQVDSQGRFTLNDVPSGPITLQFSGPGVSATVTITVNGPEQIQIAVTVTGGSARVESQHHSGSNRAEVEGGITAIDAAARTIRVAGTLVTVPLEAVIRRGDRSMQFADLLVGDMVDVRGTIDSTTFRATEVKVKSENHGHLTERKGAATGVTGACPALTFNIGLTRVTTNGSTFFKEGSCANVVEGAAVEVKGRPQEGNTLLAVQVELEDDDDDEDDDEDDDDDNESEVKGSVSGLSGTCPAIAFVVGTLNVTTSATTRFDGGCSAVLNGRRVEVKGMRQTNGSMLATRVKLED